MCSASNQHLSIYGTRRVLKNIAKLVKKTIGMYVK